MRFGSNGREPRILEFRRGVLEYDDYSSACLIVNVSSQGFLLECLDEFMVGQRMRLTSEFRPGRIMRCSVEVRHVAGGSVGAAIVEIDHLSAYLCDELISQHYATQLERRSA